MLPRMSLLRDIQSAALDPSVDLATLLRKCLVLAKRLKHDELSAWVSHELNGYADEAPLPPYRRLAVMSKGYFQGPFNSSMNNAPIAKASLPKELWSRVDESSLRDPVAALQSMAGAKTAIQGHWSADLVALCQRKYPMYEGVTLMAAWQIIPVSDIKAALDTIRTRVLEFALAIEEEAPDAGEVAPGAAPAVSREVVNQIYNVTINGGQSNIGTTGGPAIAAGHSVQFGAVIPEAAHVELREALAGLRREIDRMSAGDREDATYALSRVEAELASAAPNSTTVERYLGLLANITAVVTPHIETIQRWLVGFG
jgi:hypothetical protein